MVSFCVLHLKDEREKAFAPFREKKSHFLAPEMSWISQEATKVRTTPSLSPSSQKDVRVHQGARELLWHIHTLHVNM